MPSSGDSFAYVRLERIVVDNIKGVEHGEISLINPRRPEGASVVGLYGQNGSGKSTVIDVLEMVRSCIAGGGIGSRMVGCVDVSSDHGRVLCDFRLRQTVCGEDVRMRVSYAFSVKEEQDEEHGERTLARVYDESIAISVEDEPELRRMTKIIDASKGPVFGPAAKARRLVGSGRYTRLENSSLADDMTDTKRERVVDLSEVKKDAYRRTCSFVFRDGGIDGALVAACFEQLRRTEDAGRGVLGHELGLPDTYFMPDWCLEAMLERRDEVDLLPLYAYVALNGLRQYGVLSMHILNSSDAGNALAGSLSLPMGADITYTHGHLFEVLDKELDGHVVGDGLRFDGPSTVSGLMHRRIGNMLRTMNLVMEQVVPGMSVELEDIGTKKDERGIPWYIVSLYSRRGDRRIPFELESGGVKRLVSFINYLVVMYNDPHALVAIDEIDSGVFEYLLGELLSIVCDHGVGQLVFTSHNLRPLETIDRGYIWFTTTNPKNRYVRMSNVKATNNLRDFYYRNILLGGQREQLYDPTNNGEIELALMEAGMHDVTD